MGSPREWIPGAQLVVQLVVRVGAEENGGAARQSGLRQAVVVVVVGKMGRDRSPRAERRLQDGHTFGEILHLALDVHGPTMTDVGPRRRGTSPLFTSGVRSGLARSVRT